MTHDQLAREFSELNGIPCTGSHGYLDGKECTFSDAASILEVMILRKDWIDFMKSLYGDYVEDMIHLDYILIKDKLLKAAVEWCREHKEEKDERPK